MIKKIKEHLRSDGGKKIMKGSSIIFAMAMISSLLGYFIRMVAARAMSPEHYGLFFSIFTLIMFFFWIKDLGLMSAVTKHIPEYLVHQREDKVKTTCVIMLVIEGGISILLGITFFLLSDWLALHYFKDPLASWIIKMMVIYIIFSVVFKFYKSFFQGYQKMHLLALIEPLKNLTILITLVSLVWFMGVKAMVIGYLISCFSVLIILFIPFARLFPWKAKMQEFGPLTKQLILFGLPVIFTAIGGELISYFDTMTLTYFRSLAEVGIYNVVLPTATVLLMGSRALAITIFPMISEHWARGEYEKVKHGMKVFYTYYPFLFIPLVLGMFLIKPFLRIFFGEFYVAGSLALGILFVGIIFYIAGMVNNHALMAIGKPFETTKSVGVAAIINVILNIIFIPKWGINGAAFATAIAYAWVMIFSTYRVKRLILDV